ncbi:hypothetical protein ACFX2I_035507 [Malus domestica]
MAVKDTFYLSLGSPTLSIDDAIPARKLLQSWNQTVYPHKPTSILIISAHRETAVPTVNSISGRHDTIYDFPNRCTSSSTLPPAPPTSPTASCSCLRRLASGPRTSIASGGSTTARGSRS